MLKDTDEKENQVLKVLQSLLILNDTGKQLNQPPPMSNFDLDDEINIFHSLVKLNLPICVRKVEVISIDKPLR